MSPPSRLPPPTATRAAAAAASRRGLLSSPAPQEEEPTYSGVKRMAVTLEQAQRVGYTLLKGLLRFGFMVANNLVAIPSYILYLIILQPLRLLDSKRFWYIEGVLFKWLLAMVASWGWWAGYTVVEWGDDVKVVSEDEAMMLVNHQATGDVCTLMMCLQDKGTARKKVKNQRLHHPQTKHI